MEIWQLKTFTVVAKYLHFTRASKELNLTQSAVSHQIKSLEKEFGEKLFVRNKGKISLTPKGTLVLEYAHKMLQQIDEMKRVIQNNSEEIKGKVMVSAHTRSLDHPFIEVRYKFQQKYPDIELCFWNSDSADTVIDQVKSGKSDVGIVVGRDDYQGLLSIPCGFCELLLVTGKTHNLAGEKRVNIADLENEHWILFEEHSDMRKPVDQLFAEYNIKPPNIYTTNDSSVIRNLIIKGDGLAFLPDCGIYKELAKGRLISIELQENELKINLNLIISPDHNKITGVFVNYLLEKQVGAGNLQKTIEL